MADAPRGRPARAGGADPPTLVGAYVMDAVSEADRTSFERHLDGCEACQAEVRGLREATARLAAAAEVRPRPELRELTLTAASRIRQLPPATAEAGPAAARRPGRAAARRLRSRARAWLPRLAVGLAAVLAVLAVTMGTAMNGAEHRLGQAQGAGHAMAVVLGEPDATMRTTQVSDGGSATVVMSHRARALVFSAAGLPALPAGRGYQLWVMGRSGPRSAGLLDARGDGTAGPMVVSGLAAGDKVGITVEPAGGSGRPTSPPIVLMALWT
jgi:anti-sigma-K factor RskA